GAGGGTGVDDPGDGVAAFAGQVQVSSFVAVELRSEADQLLDPTRPLVDQHAHGVEVAEPGSGGQRVGQVQVDLFGVAAQRGGDPALGPAGRRLLQQALGQYPGVQAVLVARPDGRRQPGDTAAEDEEVQLAGRGSGHGRRGPGSVSVLEGVTPTLSISRARPKRTAPNSRASSVATVSGW